MPDDKTALDLFYDNVSKNGDRHFMVQPMGGDKVKTFSYNDTLEDAKKLAGYITSLGLPPNSQIAICSKNCAWWVIADLAIWMSGHVSVPVYPTLTAETTRYILEHCEAKLIFVGKLDRAPWKEMKKGLPKKVPKVTFPICPDAHGAKTTWYEAMELGAPLDLPVKRSRDEMGTIIYTSGSTGKPKGVMTSFGAMVDATRGIAKELKLTEHDRYLSYLPVAHGMERWLGEVVPLCTGFRIFFSESLSTFLKDLNRCRPTIFMSVPRLWTKFQAGVYLKMPEQKLNKMLTIPIFNMYFKKKILRQIGLDKCRVAGSGSAPLPVELIAWYRRLGLDLLEGYGMTENFNYSHMSRPGSVRPGYVGTPHEGVQHRIGEDGEIQVKSPGTMMGYYKNDEATADAIAEDGWLRTGDKGEVDSQQRLRITGRTKEIFKTSKGKYVAPAPIESSFVSHFLVELACVGGRTHAQPHVILQLSEAPKMSAMKSAGDRKRIAGMLTDYMEEINQTLNPHEKVAFLAIVKEDWLPENGFLTPTQKIKRGTIEKAYASKTEGWYNKNKRIIWAGKW